MKIYKKLTIENSFGLLFWIPVSICFAIQVLLSIYDPQNLVVVAITLLIFILLYLIVKDGNLYNVPITLAILYVFNNIIFAFFVKTLLLQPASTNLYAPISSYFATLVAVLALFFAVFASKAINIGKPLFGPIKNLSYLKWLSIYSFLIGISAWVLNQIILIDRRADFFDPQKSFGGFAIFDNLFYMSIVSATAYVLISTNNKKSINLYIALLFLCGLGMALIESRKIGLGLMLLSYISTCIFFRQKITKKQVVTFVAAIMFAFFVFTPIAHVYRSTLWFLPFTQKAEYLYQNYEDIFSIKNIGDNYAQIKSRKHHRYDYFDTYMSFFDRFAAIQINDDLISAADSQGLSGSKFYLTDYALILPSVIYPEKDTISLGDRLRWEYNLKDYGQVSFSTAPLISNAYCVGGNLMVFALCFYVFLILFLLFKKINWKLYENIFAIYFIIPLFFAFHEKSHGGMVTIMFREIPVNAVMLCVFHVIYTGTVLCKKESVKISS